MPYFPIKTYLCDIGLCKPKVDNSEIFYSATLFGERWLWTLPFNIF